MKIKEFCKKHKKKIAIIVVILVAILILAIGVVFFFLSQKGDMSMPFGQGEIFSYMPRDRS